MDVSHLLIERCQTGISGFDVLCNGGFVRNSVNAILGGPGAGKTIFMVQFLYNGATIFKENGLYVSFEADVTDIYKDALSFGWDLEKLDRQDKCKFLRISPDSDVTELKRDLTRLIAKYQIRRICLDPITMIGLGENNMGKIRGMVFDVASLLKRLGVTVLVANETASSDTEEGGFGGSTDVRSQYIKFLSDSITDLYSSGLGGVSDRAIRISKMRRTAHYRGPVPMEIGKAGIRVITHPAPVAQVRR